MADSKHIVEIKISYADLPGAAKGATAGAPSPGAAIPPLDISGIRQEFSALSSEIRAVVQTFKQLADVAAALSRAPAIGASGPGIPIGDISRDLVNSMATAISVATKAATGAPPPSSGGNPPKTELPPTGARSAASTAEELRRASKAYQEAAEAATQADLERVRALKLIAKERPDVKTNPAFMFEKVLKPLANHPAVQKAHAGLENSIDELFDLSKVANVEGDKATKEFRNTVRRIMKGAMEQLGGEEFDPGLVSRTRRSLVAAQKGYAQEGPAAGARAAFNIDEAIFRLASRQQVETTRSVEDAIQAVVRATAPGAGTDAGDVRRMITEVESFVAALSTVTEKNIRQLSMTKAGEERAPGLGTAAAVARHNLGITDNTTKLTAAQASAMKLLEGELKDTTDVMQTAAKVMKILVDSGRDLPGLERVIREFQKALAPKQMIDFPTTTEWNAFQSVRNALGRDIKRTPGGVLNIPPALQDTETAGILGREAIVAARQRVFEAGKGTTKEITGVPFVTATGDIKKLRVTLSQLGDTIDTVKVKAQDMSANAFDRTNIRSAIARVATWGAAAGVIYGTVNALRKGAQALIDTEAQVVSLAKVMNEANKDLDGFKRKITDTAITIAQEFGQPIKDVLETMILFGQQGLKFPAVKSLTEASALAANVTTLDQPTAASALTAATQQFGIAAADAMSIVDKFNEVANNAAVTETVLAESLKRAGLAAQNAGVNLDQFNGIVAAISEQTRQTGEQIGTALRFIFARLNTPEAEKGLARVGVQARDASGNFRGFIPILEDVHRAFQGLSESQKTQVAISLSGTRRFNTFLSLLNNFGRYQESVANSVNSAGSALREQEKIADTAAFRITQLKNSFTALAVSFGDTFLSPLKVVVEGLRSVTEIATAIPAPIRMLAATVGLGTIAFIKLSDHLTDFLGLADATRGAMGSIGSSIKQSLVGGVPKVVQQQDTAKFAVMSALAPGAVTARTVGDFAGMTKTTESFATSLGAANLALIDHRGQIVKNASAYTKFGAVVRGFRTQELDKVGTAAGVSALGINALNSGFSRFGVFLVRTSERLLQFSLVGPAAFRALDSAAASLNSKLLTTAVSVGKVAAAFGLIYGAVKLYQYISDAATQTGRDVEQSLRSEIAHREEAVAQLDKELDSVNRLAEARKALAVQVAKEQTQSPARTEENIRRGTYKSPFLERQRLRQREQAVAQEIGLSNPQLIESMDNLGNVVLSSASAFDALAASASSAQKQMLALSRLKVAQGFARDLLTAEEQGGVRGAAKKVLSTLGDIPVLGEFVPTGWADTQADTFTKALLEFRLKINKPLVAVAREARVPLRLLSTGVAAELDRARISLERASVPYQFALESMLSHIAKLPKDVGPEIFRQLGAAPEFARGFAIQAETLSRQMGTQIRPQDLINQVFLKNKSAWAKATNLIGVGREETVGKFNEAGLVQEVVDLQRGIEEQFKGGELVLFENVVGLPDQAVVEVTATGKRQIRYIADDLGNTATMSLAEVFSRASTSMASVLKFDPRVVADQINYTLAEAGRIATGAGRGALLSKDIELGANFKYELTAQQRASRMDEGLFYDLQRAQDDLNDYISEIAGSAKEAADKSDQAVSPDLLENLRKLSEEFDRTATIAKFSTEIEKVGMAFERALADIEKANITDRVREQFSEVLGAEGGVFTRDFNVPKLGSQLSAEQRVGKTDPETVAFLNSISRVRKAQVEHVVSLVQARRTIDTLFRDFQAARLPGANLDPGRLSALKEEILAAQSSEKLKTGRDLQIDLARESINVEQKQVELLQQLVDQRAAAPELIAGLAAASEMGAGDQAALLKVQQRVAQLSPAQLQKAAPQDLETLAKAFGTKALPNIARELAERMVAASGASFSQALSEASVQEGGAGKEVTESLTQRLRRLSTLVPEDRLTGVERSVMAALESSGLVEQVQAGAKLDDLELPPELTAQVAKAYGDMYRQLAKDTGTSGPQATADMLMSGSKEAGMAVGAYLRDILSAYQRTAVSPEAGESTAARDIEEAARAAQKQIDFVEKNIRANIALQQSSVETAEALYILETSVNQVAEDIVNGTRQALTELRTTQELRRFTTPLFGALAGIEVPQVDLGKFQTELSGAERAAQENPELATGLTDAAAASSALVAQLKRIHEEEQFVQQALSQFQAAGNVKGISLAREALSQLGSMSTLVSGQVENARGTLKSFGEAFRDVSVIKQLQVDIEGMLRSFDKQRMLERGDVSVQTALGRTPFSGTRPTFEQAEQGQGGFLTKFERVLADIQYKSSRGQMDFQTADRERRRASFENDEEIIALAQQRENKKLEVEVQTAEQVRARLLDYMQQGAVGAGDVQGIFRQLTMDLERAGDILPSNLGTQKIRDPRTGQMVDIPSSETKQFRGVPSLSEASKQVARIAEQVRTKQAEEQAKLITQPLLTVLDQVPGKLDAIVQALKDTAGVGAEESGLPAVVAAVEAGLASVAKTFESGAAETRSAVVQLVEFTDALSRFDPGALTSVLEEFKIVTAEGNASLRQTLETVAQQSVDSAVRAAVDSLFSRAQGRAHGGAITGPGGPTSDRVPILASPGEFVINAASARRIGLPMLEAMNSFGGLRGRRTRGRFAFGGEVLDKSDSELLPGFSYFSEDEKVSRELEMLQSVYGENSDQVKRLRKKVGTKKAAVDEELPPAGGFLVYHDRRQAIASGGLQVIPADQRKSLMDPEFPDVPLPFVRGFLDLREAREASEDGKLHPDVVNRLLSDKVDGVLAERAWKRDQQKRKKVEDSEAHAENQAAMLQRSRNLPAAKPPGPDPEEVFKRSHLKFGNGRMYLVDPMTDRRVDITPQGEGGGILGSLAPIGRKAKQVRNFAVNAAKLTSDVLFGTTDAYLAARRGDYDDFFKSYENKSAVDIFGKTVWDLTGGAAADSLKSVAHTAVGAVEVLGGQLTGNDDMLGRGERRLQKHVVQAVLSLPVVIPVAGKALSLGGKAARLAEGALPAGATGGAYTRLGGLAERVPGLRGAGSRLTGRGERILAGVEAGTPEMRALRASTAATAQTEETISRLMDRGLSRVEAESYLSGAQGYGARRAQDYLEWKYPERVGPRDVPPLSEYKEWNRLEMEARARGLEQRGAAPPSPTAGQYGEALDPALRDLDVGQTAALSGAGGAPADFIERVWGKGIGTKLIRGVGGLSGGVAGGYAARALGMSDLFGFGAGVVGQHVLPGVFKAIRGGAGRGLGARLWGGVKAGASGLTGGAKGFGGKLLPSRGTQAVIGAGLGAATIGGLPGLALGFGLGTGVGFAGKGLRYLFGRGGKKLAGVAPRVKASFGQAGSNLSGLVQDAVGGTKSYFRQGTAGKALDRFRSLSAEDQSRLLSKVSAGRMEDVRARALADLLNESSVGSTAATRLPGEARTQPGEFPSSAAPPQRVLPLSAADEAAAARLRAFEDYYESMEYSATPPNTPPINKLAAQRLQVQEVLAQMQKNVAGLPVIGEVPPAVRAIQEELGWEIALQKAKSQIADFEGLGPNIGALAQAQGVRFGPQAWARRAAPPAELAELDKATVRARVMLESRRAGEYGRVQSEAARRRTAFAEGERWREAAPQVTPGKAYRPAPEVGTPEDVVATDDFLATNAVKLLKSGVLSDPESIARASELISRATWESTGLNPTAQARRAAEALAEAQARAGVPVNAVSSAAAPGDFVKSVSLRGQQLSLEEVLSPEELRRLRGLAAGGKITGPGGPHGDRVPVLTSAGEYVLNAAAVNRLGLPVVDLMNRTGRLPKFAEGGSVDGAGGGGLSISVDTAAITVAVAEGIKAGLQGESLSVDVDTAAQAIAEAVAAAMRAIELPKLEVNTDNVKVGVDIPAGGIKLDMTGLSGAGQALGADVLTRLEVVEGSVAGVREDASAALDRLDALGASGIDGVVEKMSVLEQTVNPLADSVRLLDSKLETTQQSVLDRVREQAFSVVNEELNNYRRESNPDAELARLKAVTDARLSEIIGRLNNAEALAHRGAPQR